MKEEVQSLPLKDKIKNRIMQGDATLEELVGLTEKSRRHNVISDIRSLIDGKQDSGDWCPIISSYIVPVHGEKSRGFPLDKEIWYTYTQGYVHPADIRRLAEKMRMTGIEKMSGAEHTDNACIACKAKFTEKAYAARRDFLRLYITRGKITVKRREELVTEEAKREYFEFYPACLKTTKEQLKKDAENIATLLEAGIPEVAEKVAYCLTYKENGMYPYFDKALVIKFA